jgi:DNA-directed RNA polymerase specialized sigma24 family protein
MTALLEPRFPPQPELIPDAVLLSRVAKRDSTALVELERRHHGSLYAQAFGILMDARAAERVVRDAFSQLWFDAPEYSVLPAAWDLLRDMTREIANAEQALRSNARWR